MSRAFHSCVAVIAALAISLPMPAVRAATLLVANKGEASLSVLRAPGYELIATLPTGIGPHEVAVSPSGEFALVSNYGDRERPGRSLTLVDLMATRVSATIALPEGARPHGIEWLDDDTAAVTAEGLRSLLVIDVEERRVRNRIAIDQGC